MRSAPSVVQERILQAMARLTIGHLDPAFIELVDEIKALLQSKFLIIGGNFIRSECAD